MATMAMMLICCANLMLRLEPLLRLSLSSIWSAVLALVTVLVYGVWCVVMEL